MEKLKIHNLDDKKSIECQFNPSELSFSKSNKWDQKDSAGKNSSTVTFNSEGLQTIQLSLTFDTYECETPTPVTTLTDRVMDLMRPDVTDAARNSKNKQTRPPHLQLVWGKSKSPRVVLSEVSQKFTLFASDGTPVRAVLQLKLQEVPNPPPAPGKSGQNPTSRATGARRSRMIQPGDTLDWIAAQELGDAGAWRRLAELNDIDDPRHLRAGHYLVIPPEH